MQHPLDTTRINGGCSVKDFLSIVGDGINEREAKKFEEGLNSKVKLSLPFNKW